MNKPDRGHSPSSSEGAAGERAAPARRITPAEGVFRRESPPPDPRRRPWRIAFGVVLALLLLGAWARHAIHESLVDLTTTHLESILRAHVTALDLWFDNERGFVEAWAEQPFLPPVIDGLIRAADTGPQALRTAEAQSVLRNALGRVTDDPNYVGYWLVDPAGMVLAAHPDAEMTGLRLTPRARELLADAFQGRTRATRPHPASELIAGYGDSAGGPWILAAAPVPGRDSAPVAALVFRIDPRREFSEILSAARFGRTGHTYAFDSRARVLAGSRFTDDAVSAEGVVLRDPGGNTTRGYVPELPVEARPLTRMAASAVRGASGIDTQGYRDYRGVKVFGAWQWLPEYDFGVATEIAVDELERLLQPLEVAFWGLFGAVVFVSGALVTTFSHARFLRRRIETVRQLGQYTLEEKLAEGGMGTIYRARHALLRRPTAIKLLRDDRVNEDDMARFEREVQLASLLSHPNTIEIYDYGRTPEGLLYYVMEYLDGITLADLIEDEGPVPPERTIHIVQQICGSLQEAHGLSLIHRDIKPLNIILAEHAGMYDVVKVLDFGLVKDIAVDGDAEITVVGAIMGTPAYIAPERLRDPRHADARSDIYSVGCVAYNLLTAEPVFDGASAVEICHKVLSQDPEPPSKRLGRPLPARLENLIMACIARDPQARPESMAQVRAALEDLQRELPWTQEQARAWWERFRATIRLPNEADPSGRSP